MCSFSYDPSMTSPNCSYRVITSSDLPEVRRLYQLQKSQLATIENSRKSSLQIPEIPSTTSSSSSSDSTPRAIFNVSMNNSSNNSKTSCGIRQTASGRYIRPSGSRHREIHLDGDRSLVNAEAK